MPGEFAGHLGVDFFVFIFGGLLPWKKKNRGGKNPPENPRQNSNQNLGALRPKFQILQGSGLECLGIANGGGSDSWLAAYALRGNLFLQGKSY